MYEFPKSMLRLEGRNVSGKALAAGSRLIAFAAVLLLTAFATATWSQEAKANLEDDLLKRLHKESQSIMEEGSFFKVIDGKQVDVPLRKEPVFRHIDQTRNEQGGGVWMIGDKGRPMAMSVLYTFPDATHWVQSMRSLSPSKDIGGNLKGGNRWRPTAAGIEFKPLPKAPKPSKSKKLLFTQLKRQAQRFSGHEFWRGSRHELRLIPRELHKYEDPDNGIVTGAIFAIAHNTNPETYLVLEVQADNDQRTWQYALARFGFAELHINIDEKEVWKKPLIGSAGSRDPYYLFHLPRQTF